MNEQARRSTPPNRVRLPTDRQFASGCSPRRLEPTQLPSATELWHTPTRTFTVLMSRHHGRTHSRMLLAGIQAEFGLDPRSKHSGVTILGSRISSPQPQFSKEPQKIVSQLNVLVDIKTTKFMTAAGERNCRVALWLKITLPTS